MGIKSSLTLMAARATIASQPESQVFMGKTPSCNLAGDFSHNIIPYHEKPLRKGAFKKKLFKNREQSLINKLVFCNYYILI